MQPTPAIIASRIHSAISCLSHGGPAPSRLALETQGCSVRVNARLGHLSVSVSASDGSALIECNGGVFSVADKAGNYASASALETARAIAASLNFQNNDQW